MKRKNIDWKLAVVCPMAALIFSGCINEYPAVIEDMSHDKMLIKDAKDGKKRMVVFSPWRRGQWLNERIRFSKKGDTIIIIQQKTADIYKKSKYLSGDNFGIRFNEDSIEQRQQDFIFDSLKNEMIQEKQGLQR